MRLVSSLFIYLFPISWFYFNSLAPKTHPNCSVGLLYKCCSSINRPAVPTFRTFLFFLILHIPSHHDMSSDSQPNVRVCVGATRVRRLFRAQWTVACICLRLAAFNQLASARALLFNQVSQTINSHQIGNLSSSPCSCRRVLAANARSDPEWQSLGRDLVHNLKTNVKRLRFTR